MKLNSSFLVGLLVGAVVSGLSVWFISTSGESDSKKRPHKVAKKEREKHTSEVAFKDDASSKDVSKSTEKKSKVDNSSIEITTVDDSISVDTVLIDSAAISEIIKDTSEVNFMVRKDVLMRTLTFKFNKGVDSTTLIDSLKESLDIVEKIKHETYFVELWESPLGFSGYKTSGNRIMVFGLDSVASFDLKLEEGYKVLKANKTKYKIMNETEFRPLSKLPSK